MKRTWMPLYVILTVMLLLSAAACKKAPPAPPTDLDSGSTTSAPPDRPAPAPTPSTTGDQTQNPWTGELRELQDEAERRGLLGTVYFALDSSALDTAARERLSKNAQFLTGDGRGLSLTLEGHCDERGTNQYNIALGERRSNAARDYLISLGVDGGRLQTVSYGEERPQCTTGGGESCWAQNRRAYFRISAAQ